MTAPGLDPDGPRVVAFGGGHGLAITLRAVRRYASHITAVVSVADDGGSSGRLRRELGIPAPGDLRKCLLALAGGDTLLGRAFDHRFADGPLAGHALGNLVIAGLAETADDFPAALAEAGRLLDAVGEVIPATAGPVTLRAEVGGALVEGQVAISTAPGRIGRVELVPADPAASEEALTRIVEADQIVLAPGSLFTSLVPVVCVPAVGTALHRASARVVQVCNLRTQSPETDDLDAADHLRAVLDHGARVDVFLVHRRTRLPVDDAVIAATGVKLVCADVASPAGSEEGHDPVRLAEALRALL